MKGNLTRSRKRTGLVGITESRSVTIEKISNGFIASAWKQDRQIKKFAKTEKEAKTIASKLL